jgi:hypothetical protein
VTAIRTGSVNPDAGWTPLFATPRYPDWPSGHGGVAGAAQRVLTAFLGTFAPAPIEVTSPTEAGSTHTFDPWSQITREVIDARVWERHPLSLLRRGRGSARSPTRLRRPAPPAADVANDEHERPLSILSRMS